MTDAEWAAFAAEVEATFRGDLAEDREAALRRHVGGWTYEQGQAAVAALVARGQVMMPAPGEFAQVRRLLEQPRTAASFAEALPVVLDELLRAKRAARGRHAEALVGAVGVIVARCGEGAGRWAAARGFGLLLEQGLYDPDREGMVRAALRKEYEAACAGAEQDERAGLAVSAAARVGVQQPRRVAVLLPERPA